MIFSIFVKFACAQRTLGCRQSFYLLPCLSFALHDLYDWLNLHTMGSKYCICDSHANSNSHNKNKNQFNIRMPKESFMPDSLWTEWKIKHRWVINMRIYNAIRIKKWYFELFHMYHRLIEMTVNHNRPEYCVFEMATHWNISINLRLKIKIQNVILLIV